MKLSQSLTGKIVTLMVVVFATWTQAAVAEVAAFKANDSAAFGPSIPIDDTTYCFGQNQFDQCVLYVGSRNSCNNVTPCNNNSFNAPEIKRAVGEIAIGQSDTTFCYGMDNTTDQCKLFVGSKEACDNVAPCSFGFKRIDDLKARR